MGKRDRDELGVPRTRRSGAKAAVARAHQHLRFVADLAKLTSGTTDRDALLRAFGDLALDRLGDLVVVDLLADTGTVERALVRGRRRLARALTALDTPGSEAGGDPAGRAARTGRARIVHLPGSRGPGGAVRSILTGPVVGHGRVIGSATVAARSPDAFVADDVPFWQEVGSQLGVALDTVGARRRHDRIVDTLQSALLPLDTPRLPGFACAARYRPATQANRVGGDWWDAFVADDELVITVGDVVGHDLDAAVAMGWLRHAARAYAAEHADIAVVLDRLSAYAAHQPSTAYATTVLAFADPSTGKLRYGCAGHPPPLLLRGSSARYLDEATRPPLGVPTARQTASTAQLQPGDTVLFYTDGLYERRDTPLDDRLAELAGRALAAGPIPLDRLCGRLIVEMTGAGSTDDIAMVALRRADG